MHSPKTMFLAGLVALATLLALGSGCARKHIDTNPPPKRVETETETVSPQAPAAGAEVSMEVVVEDLESEPLPGEQPLQDELAMQEAEPVVQDDPIPVFHSVEPGTEPPVEAEPVTQEAETIPVVHSVQPATEAPAEAGTYDEEGLASWVADEFQGLSTASGEIYDPNLLTAAHRTLPMGTMISVTNLENGRTVEVRVNDRGPFKQERVVDVSRAAAEALDMIDRGVARVGLSVQDEPAQVEAPAPVVGGVYYVQVGAFSSKASADAVLDQLLKAGYAQSRVVVPTGAATYKVQAGVFQTEEEAWSALDFLRERFPDSYLITD